MTNQATPRDESRAATGNARRWWSRLSRRARVVYVLWVLVVLALGTVRLVNLTRQIQTNPTQPFPTLTTEIAQQAQQDEPQRDQTKAGLDDDGRTTIAALTIAPEFEPENGELSNCVGSFAERPGCGADGRGGRGQTLVFVALLGGLVFIGWRIVAGAKKQQRLRQRAGRRA